MDTKGMSFAERNEYWDMVLEDYDSSGLNRKDYCTKNDIPIRTFKYWEDKLRGKSTSSSHVAFAEISDMENEDWCSKSDDDSTRQQTTLSFETELVIGCGFYTLGINSSTPMELVKIVLKEVSNA